VLFYFEWGGERAIATIPDGENKETPRFRFEAAPIDDGLYDQHCRIHRNARCNSASPFRYCEFFLRALSSKHLSSLLSALKAVALDGADEMRPERLRVNAIPLGGASAK
jgi:hypothetical protein